MNCIETNNLTYKYSEDAIVVNNINLQVPEGCIYGFLGKNGAGKTTTLRLLLGLLKRQEGSIKIFNKSFDKNRIEILKQTGSLIESPSFYAHLSAKDNLKILQKIYQCPKQRIEEVLQIVGLTIAENKKVSQFSLGMKQRLSIGIALLHNPKLLILDEPTNGLDPNGIIDIRDLLKKINTDLGTTIIVSSHLLSEIERLVTHIGIINKGSLLFQGTYAELKSMQSESSTISFRTNDSAKAMDIASSNNIKVKLVNDQIIIPFVENKIISKLNEQFVTNKIEVYQIRTQEKDLESIFIDLTT
jgi:ABC-2 type transport system ATP-binding protein